MQKQSGRVGENMCDFMLYAASMRKALTRLSTLPAMLNRTFYLLYMTPNNA